jgi:branched-chain amino acid transport system substrate-binding protein
MVIGTGFYWDLNDATRAFAKRFSDRFRRMPTQYQASVYAAVRHYLEAVAAAGTVESGKVMETMRATPAYYFSDHAAHIRPDGRTIYDVHVMQVKAPGESKCEWDLLRLVQTIPGESAFRPADQSACPFVRQAGQ